MNSYIFLWMKIMPSDSTWTGLTQNHAFVYYQGRSEHQGHVARYIGDQPFRSTTDESLQYQKPIFTMPRENVWIYPEIDEIFKPESPSFFTKPASIARSFVSPQPTYDRSEPKYDTLYPNDESGKLAYYKINKKLCSLGQTGDINNHQKRMTSLYEQREDINAVILYGASRGASTTFAALAENAGTYRHIKLCILEAPFDSIPNLIANWFTDNPALINFVHTLSKPLWGGKYSLEDSEQPIARVDKYPDDIPTVIISSRSDTVVPYKNSLNLASRVAAKRICAHSDGSDEPITPVYFLSLSGVGHTHYCTKGSTDADLYQAFIHHIYQKHNLPHVEDIASTYAGNDDLINLTSDLMKPIILEADQFNRATSDKEKRVIQRHAFGYIETINNDESRLPKDKLEFLKITSNLSVFSSSRQYKNKLLGMIQTHTLAIAGEERSSLYRQFSRLRQSNSALVRFAFENRNPSSARELYYQHSSYVAECFNTLTNIGFVLVGLGYGNIAAIAVGFFSAISHAFPLQRFQNLDILGVILIGFTFATQLDMLIENPEIFVWSGLTLLFGMIDFLKVKDQLAQRGYAAPVIHSAWHVCATLVIATFLSACSNNGRDHNLIFQPYRLLSMINDYFNSDSEATAFEHRATL